MLIELKKQDLNGALGIASKQAKMVIPQMNEKSPLALLPISNPRRWPDIVAIMDNQLMIIRVQEKDACTLLPFKRLDHNEIHTLGLVKFKDLLNACKAIWISEGLTWRELAKLLQEYKLSAFLHKQYKESIKR